MVAGGECLALANRVLDRGVRALGGSAPGQIPPIEWCHNRTVLTPCKWLLHAIRLGSTQERQEIQQIVERGAPGEYDLAEVLALMDRHGSVQYAMGMAQHFVAEAKSCLAPFEDSPHKEALTVVADYVITRDH